VSQDNVAIVRKPLRVREQSKSRSLADRLAIRFPRLAAAYGRLILRLPPTSRVRHAVLWRATRNGMEAFNRRDVEAAVGPGSPDFEYIPPREWVEAGFFEPCYRGPVGFGKYMGTWFDVVGADLRIEPVELIDLGDRIAMLAEFAGSGQASGAPFTGKIATVSVFQHGKAIRVQAYLDYAEALEAVGLRE
jgi:ketosteroid isomerase-like protein